MILFNSITKNFFKLCTFIVDQIGKGTSRFLANRSVNFQVPNKSVSTVIQKQKKPISNHKSIRLLKQYSILPLVKDFKVSCYKREFSDQHAVTKGRHNFHKETEEVLNNQIGIEFDAAVAYLSMSCYFGRTDIALPGCQGYFMNMFKEEQEHAAIFLNYILMRGGKVNLKKFSTPSSSDWKCIANAFEVALEMEKCVKQALQNVYCVAEKHLDLEVMDIVSTQFMEEQNRSINQIARLLTRAKMTFDPMGEYLFDHLIFNSFVKMEKKNLMYKYGLKEWKENDTYK